MRKFSLLLVLLLISPVLAKGKFYRHPESGLEFPNHLSWKKPPESLERGMTGPIAEGHVAIAYQGDDLELTVYLYPPELPLEQDFECCREIMTTSLLSRQKLLDEAPWKLSKKVPKALQATYQCSGLTAYAKFTQIVMFEVTKNVRCKCRISSNRDTRPVTRAFLTSLKL